MEINIREDLLPTLENVAKSQGKNVEDYIKYFMEAHLKSKYREEIINKLPVDIEELKFYDSAISITREERFTEEKAEEKRIEAEIKIDSVNEPG